MSNNAQFLAPYCGWLGQQLSKLFHRPVPVVVSDSGAIALRATININIQECESGLLQWLTSLSIPVHSIRQVDHNTVYLYVPSATILINDYTVSFSGGVGFFNDLIVASMRHMIKDMPIEYSDLSFTKTTEACGGTSITAKLHTGSITLQQFLAIRDVLKAQVGPAAKINYNIHSDVTKTSSSINILDGRTAYHVFAECIEYNLNRCVIQLEINLQLSK